MSDTATAESQPVPPTVPGDGSNPQRARRPYAVLLDAIREIADPCPDDLCSPGDYAPGLYRRIGRLKAIAERALEGGGLTNALGVRITLEDARRLVAQLRAGRDHQRLEIKDLRRQRAALVAQRDAYRMAALVAEREMRIVTAYLDDLIADPANKGPDGQSELELYDLETRLRAGVHRVWAVESGVLGKLTSEAHAAVARLVDVGP